jgi:hypothetical protein
MSDPKFSATGVGDRRRDGRSFRLPQVARTVAVPHGRSLGAETEAIVRDQLTSCRNRPPARSSSRR